MAMTRDDLMGLGHTRFVTNKLTELRPAIPNQVTEGDSFEATFTIPISFLFRSYSSGV